VPKIEVSASDEAAENPDDGGIAMSIEGDAQRVTVYIGSSDTWHGHNLAMAIVERCRKMGMAGATASLGVLGFGKHSCIHKAHLFRLSAGLPEKVEIVDRPERIALLLPVLEEMVDGGLIIVQDVRAVRYTPHSTPT
jgi:PII-like signaling protein